LLADKQAWRISAIAEYAMADEEKMWVSICETTTEMRGRQLAKKRTKRDLNRWGKKQGQVEYEEKIANH
jgi:hypothetical protein